MGEHIKSKVWRGLSHRGGGDGGVQQSIEYKWITEGGTKVRVRCICGTEFNCLVLSKKTHCPGCGRSTDIGKLLRGYERREGGGTQGE